MALLYAATLIPSKLELVGAWARTRPWFQGDKDAALTQVGNYRFDDPAGEVGIEVLLVRAGDGPVLQVPLTYRDAPLPGGDRFLIGNTEHSVLGTRWVYDAPGDPVYVATTTAAIVDGGHEAGMLIEVDGVMTKREPTVTVLGSGGASTGPLEVIRIPGSQADEKGYATLTGQWAEHPDAVILARIPLG
jgi:hypothetical protein